MKVTRYPQSCLKVEHNRRTLLIDPGVHFLQSHTLDELKGIEAVLYTHEHPDHYDPKVADALKEQSVPLFANESTAKLIGDGCTVITDGQEFEAAGMHITARELPHCLLSTGKPGPQNTGYVIEKVLFHPGDGKEIAELQVDNLALPITGPDISVLDALNFARQVQAKVAIPIHNTGIRLDPQAIVQYADWGGLDCEIRVLGDGESTEL